MSAAIRWGEGDKLSEHFARTATSAAASSPPARKRRAELRAHSSQPPARPKQSRNRSRPPFAWGLIGARARPTSGPVVCSPMTADADRTAFEGLAAAGADDDGRARALAARLKARLVPSDLQAMAALWIHGAAAAPERIPAIYDAACEGWTGQPLGVAAINTSGGAPEMIREPTGTPLWVLLNEPRPKLEAVNLTTQDRRARGPRLAQHRRPRRALRVRLPRRSTAIAQAIRRSSASTRSPAARRDRWRPAPRHGHRQPLRPGGAGPRGPGPEELPPRSTTSTRASCSATTSGTSSPATRPPPCTRWRSRPSSWPSSAITIRRCSRHGALPPGLRSAGGRPDPPGDHPHRLGHGRRTPPLLPVKWETVWDKPLPTCAPASASPPTSPPFPPTSSNS